MRIFTHLILSVLLCSALVSSCQSTKKLKEQVQTKHAYSIKGDFNIIETDNLGKIYLVSDNNELLQYDQDYNLLYKFSVNTLGSISSIDVSNPQKILIYYPDFQFIVFVDNTLSEIKRLNLESMGFWDIQGVGLSNDNLIWIYDPVNYKMIKIEESGKVRLSSNEAFFGDLDDIFAPKVYAEDSNVFLYSESEVMLFDLFGQHLKTMPVPNQALQFFENQIVALENNKLKLIPIKLETFGTENDIYFESENINIKDFSIREKTLYLLDNQGVIVKE